MYAYFERVVLALDHVLPRLDFNVNSPSRLQELEDGFARLSCRNHAGEPIYRGVVGAIDGIAINIDRSSLGKDGVKNPQAYFGRKVFFSLNVQAMGDAKKRFIWASVQHEGSCHDSAALR